MHRNGRLSRGRPRSRSRVGVRHAFRGDPPVVRGFTETDVMQDTLLTLLEGQQTFNQMIRQINQMIVQTDERLNKLDERLNKFDQSLAEIKKGIGALERARERARERERELKREH